MDLRRLVEEQDVCSLPWLHAEVNLQNNTVHPCCKYHGNIGHVSEGLANVWQNNFESLRNNFVNGIKVDQCKACDVPQDVFSYKKWKNKAYIPIMDSNNTLPKVFHFSLRNTCNFACRMCGPNFSSTLAQLTKKSETLQNYIGIEHTIDNKFDIQKLEGSFKDLMFITLSGGEPLLGNDTVELIKLVQKEAKNIKSVSFATNMSTLNVELFDELTKLDCTVIFNISIDGIQRVHEYIRHKSNYQEMLDNIKFVRTNYPNFKFGINSTISILNVGYVSELLLELERIQETLDVKFGQFNTTPVLNRSFLHPKILPEEIKQTYISKIKESNITTSIKDSEMLLPTALFLLEQTSTESLDDFVKFTKEFDRISGTDVTSVYPEFKSIFGIPAGI